MVCDKDPINYSQYWFNGSFVDGSICPYWDQVGVEPTALLVFVPIGIALYLYSGSVMLPLVVAWLVGGVMITQLPGVAADPAVLFMLVIVWVMGLVVVIYAARERM